MERVCRGPEETTSGRLSFTVSERSVAPAPICLRGAETGQIVVFDPSWDPPGWGENTRRGTRDLLRTVDIYMPNVEELKHLTGRADWRGAVAEVADLPSEMVVKRGPEGATCVRQGAWVDMP